LNQCNYFIPAQECFSFSYDFGDQMSIQQGVVKLTALLFESRKFKWQQTMRFYYTHSRAVQTVGGYNYKGNVPNRWR